jgi:hypothetical protein
MPVTAAVDRGQGRGEIPAARGHASPGSGPVDLADRQHTVLAVEGEAGPVGVVGVAGTAVEHADPSRPEADKSGPMPCDELTKAAPTVCSSKSRLVSLIPSLSEACAERAWTQA